MGIFNFLKRFWEKNNHSDKLPAINSEKSIVYKATGLDIHNDIKDLIWIENGPMKNYNHDQGLANKIEASGITIEIILSWRVEPSSIDTSLEIYQIDDISKVERPPYYPSYKDLSAEQRWIYLSTLSNPYDKKADIGYIFILYYGLERHLLVGNFDEAFRVILKLRDIHENKSFQYYSGNALVLSCIYHKRPDMMMEFIDSLDNDYEMVFDDNLFLLSAWSFNMPLYARDIIRLSKASGFKNRNYITKYPDLFKSTMDELLEDRFLKDNVTLKELMSSESIMNINKVSFEEIRLFANMSLIEEKIRVPLILEVPGLRESLYNLLGDTHQSLKANLAELRKTKNRPIESLESEKIRDKKVLTFDSIAEKELLKKLESESEDTLKRHFIYIQLQDFYYKFRDLDEKHVEDCVKYCLEDINSLKELQESYRLQKKESFKGRIPAFKRLAIIYEKSKLYDKAIDICEWAIKYYDSLNIDKTEFEKRREKLSKKKK